MGSISQAFNTMMGQFLDSLMHTFPEEPKLSDVKTAFEALSKINVRKPMEMFTAALSEYAPLVTAKDPTLFDKPIELPGGLNMSTLWKLPDVSDETRGAIWQYIQTLYMLGVAVQSLPDTMLQAIETTAAALSSQPNAMSMPPDMNALASMFMGTMGGVFNAPSGQGTKSKKSKRLT
jgi:hypothetical protein